MKTNPFYNYRRLIQPLRKVLAKGLTEGVGIRKPGKFCIEAAVCYVLDLPHGDNPKSCVGEPDRQLAIGLNDALWSSNQARAEGLAEFAVAHLGSATMTASQRVVWTNYIVEQTIRRIVPLALFAAADQHLDVVHQNALIDAGVRCLEEGTQEAARAAAACAMSVECGTVGYELEIARARRAARAASEAAAGAVTGAYTMPAIWTTEAEGAAAEEAEADGPLIEMAQIAVEAYALARG